MCVAGVEDGVCGQVELGLGEFACVVLVQMSVEDVAGMFRGLIAYCSVLRVP